MCVFIAQYANEQMEGVQGQHILAVCKAFVKLNLMVKLYK
jgi:beta-glucosidase-like glycosyl hydrolase